ncbi:Hypothetical protein A7982_01842 [Minicystis rosea]|nr:Hypothetical protein A7982_01842 [Minicystis rosea]
MKRTLQSGLFLVCVLASAAGMYNVMSDNIEVERLAQQVACGDEGAACKAQKTFMERSPLGQTFDFSTTKRKVSVRCTRAFVLVGDYACALR